MAENYKLVINDGEEIAVRLVGFINEKECEAILNVEEAARKISTAESIGVHSVKDVFCKRFVVVVREISKTFGNEVPHIFISPHISQVTYPFSKGDREFGCLVTGGLTLYKFIRITDDPGA